MKKRTPPPPAAGQRVGVIGDGGWGTALAMLLHNSGHAVSIWGPFPEYLAQIRKTGANELYLPGVPLPPGIRWTHDRRAVVRGADVLVVAVPTRFFRSTLEGFRGLISPSCRVVSVAKGLDADSHKRMSEVAEEILGHPSVSALSGPSHAEEVARRIPTAVTLASRNPQHRRDLQRVFSTRRFRVYTSDDIVGVELGGALKNVIALAVGVSDGLGFGDNTRAALITRGLAEITRLGCALGARPDTFSGLSGMGDLIVTCTSRLSRNRAVGERLGRGESIDAILGSMKQVAEGVWNCAAARALAHQAHVEAPVTEQVYAVVHEGRQPEAAVRALLSRNLKQE